MSARAARIWALVRAGGIVQSLLYTLSFIPYEMIRAIDGLSYWRERI
jgi:hypothetical protein